VFHASGGIPSCAGPTATRNKASSFPKLSRCCQSPASQDKTLLARKAKPSFNIKGNIAAILRETKINYAAYVIFDGGKAMIAFSPFNLAIPAASRPSSIVVSSCSNFRNQSYCPNLLLTFIQVLKLPCQRQRVRLLAEHGLRVACFSAGVLRLL
jgi:hypothetical protein